jgi:hypothetical protein
MAVETADDRAYMLNIDDWGVAATYTPAGGSPSTVNGIFDNDIVEVDAGGGVPMAVRQPRFVCREADISSAADGDAITISAVNYTIRVVDHDGTGMTTLTLERA